MEKGRADSERKKAAEACKLLENEKNKVVEKEGDSNHAPLGGSPQCHTNCWSL